MSARLLDSLATTPALDAIFSDRAVLQALLDVEAALARVEARLGLIPDSAAATIAAAAKADAFDVGALARDSRRSSTVAIPVVQALIDGVAARGAASARFVHWGATSQDVVDTAMVLVLADARAALQADHVRLARALRDLSNRTAGAVMLARTLLQPAPPTTFGLKAAQWYAEAARSWARLQRAADEMLVVQLGGASGTRAAFGGRGADVSRLLAAELRLADPDAPWHAQRDRLGAFAAACGVYTAALGKIARDVSLLMQSEIAEAAEPGGGSSTMPQKQNPAGCAIALAAATRTPGLVAAFLTGMVQEHERAVGGWQAEWPTLAALVQAAGAALASMADVAAALTIDADRMRANIDATRGAVFAERAMLRLTEALGRTAAHRLVADAVVESRQFGRGLGDVLRSRPEAAAAAPPEFWSDLEVPERYLGDAEALRRRLLDAYPIV